MHCGGIGDKLEAFRSILTNGDEAISLYLKGLLGSTTPQQRKYYNMQIANIARDLPGRVEWHLEHGKYDYNEVSKKSSLRLARIFKEERQEVEQADNLVKWCDLTSRMALSYYYAGKTEKSLAYIAEIEKLSYDPMYASFLDALKIKSTNLRLQITEPDKAFQHQLDNLQVFLK